MSKEKVSAKSNSNVICNLYPTKPSEYLKLFNPYEARDKQYEIKKEDEIHTDEPIMAKLLKESDKQHQSPTKKRNSNREHDEDTHNDQLAQNTANKLDEHGNPYQNEQSPLHVVFSEKLDVFSKIRLLIRDILHPEHTSSLLKILFNSIIGMVVCAVILIVYRTMQEDLNKKRYQEMEAVLREINDCRQEYYDNRCEPEKRTYATQEFCQQKEECMNQDAMQVIHDTKLTASLIAEIMNEFVEPLGWKTILIIFCVILSIILFNCSIRNHGRRAPSKEYEEEMHERSYTRFQNLMERVHAQSDINHKRNNPYIGSNSRMNNSQKKHKKE